ncbi:hypothetical protein AD428_00080 [Achromobacter sp. DMS1]|nr:hypothetical protein AD428_00080 [Achromobacter sp. DMS1]
MPDARWLLFVLLVQQAAEKQMKMDLEQVRPGGPDVAVVLGPDGTPVDVVSRENYAGHVTDRLIGKGMVASVVTDRETGRERLHNQSFDLADNEGFVHAAEQWAAYRNIIVDAHERWSYHLHREMVQQALRAEMRNPQIGTLKAAIEQAAAERNAVGDDEPVEAHHAAERKLRAAIWALQEAIAQGVED